MPDYYVANVYSVEVALHFCADLIGVRFNAGELEIESFPAGSIRNAVVWKHYYAATFFAYTLFISFNSFAICFVPLALLCCDKTLHFTSLQSSALRCHTMQLFSEWKRTANQLKAKHKCMKWKKKCATYFEQYGDNAKMMMPFVCLDASYGYFVCVHVLVWQFLLVIIHEVLFRAGSVGLPVYMLAQQKSRFAVGIADLLLFRIVCFFCDFKRCVCV